MTHLTGPISAIAMALFFVGSFFVGCGDDAAPEESVSPAVPDQPTAPPIPPPDPNDPIGQQMVLRQAQFAPNMEPSTPIFRGTLTAGAHQDYQAVLQSDRCFKIIGVGGAGVTDLDLFLFDPQGTQMQEDTATDAYPVLGLNHPICPDLAGSYRVRVRMFEGAGEFGVQVFHAQSI
jgi:hypothetical protein